MAPSGATAMPFTVSSGRTPPGTETGRTLPVVVASRKTGRWLTALARVAPTATTVPPGATVTPVTDSAAARPSVPVGRHVVPVPLLV